MGPRRAAPCPIIRSCTRTRTRTCTHSLRVQRARTALASASCPPQSTRWPCSSSRSSGVTASACLPVPALSLSLRRVLDHGLPAALLASPLHLTSVAARMRTTSVAVPQELQQRVSRVLARLASADTGLPTRGRHSLPMRRFRLRCGRACPRLGAAIGSEARAHALQQACLLASLRPAGRRWKGKGALHPGGPQWWLQTVSVALRFPVGMSAFLPQLT